MLQYVPENATPAHVLAIYKRVKRLGDKLGDTAGAEFKWLSQFASLLITAHEQHNDNFNMLWPAAWFFIVKYRLLERLE